MVIKCHPRAYAQCPTRYLCESLNEAEFMEGSECDKFNQQILNQPMANADRIRCMSDEELADFIGLKSLCNHIQREEDGWCDRHGSCTDCIAEWLRTPAKEETP